MANYPEWVMKHKVKGTYINHVKGKYYLYAAHSKRIKGTNKVKRIFDGYLGRITEDEGLIPPKDKVEKSVFVMEYGLSSTILYICKDIHSGFRRSFSKNGDFVMLASVLSFIYGKYNNFLYKQSYLSVVFAGIDMDITATKEQKNGIERGIKMIRDMMSNHFKDDISRAMTCLSLVYKVKINNKIYQSQIPTSTKELIKKYKIKWED
jgi:hypothetical protein